MGRVVKSDPAARRLWLNDATRGGAVPAPFSALCEASPDAFDAVAAALALLDPQSLDRQALDTFDDPRIPREGWIWGVPSGHARPR
jgi:hypothetical protein